MNTTRILLLLTLCFCLPAGPLWAAPKPLVINKAGYNKKTQTLQVQVRGRGLGESDTAVLLHGDGGVLDEQPLVGNRVNFSVPLKVAATGAAGLGQVPCSVEVRVGNRSAVKKVSGASAECSKRPACKILSPTSGAAIPANTPFDFSAKATLKDRRAKPLTYEWDFGGGAMGVDGSGVVPNSTVRARGLSGTTQFVRDNSYYRIRFTATDADKRSCEAAVTVKVGNPPSDEANFPAKVAEAAAPHRGSENNGIKDDIVVLPFEDWSMQNQSDSRMLVNSFYPFNTKHSNLRAHVIRKGSVGTAKPVYLDDAGDDAVELKYSAASNPLDPVGPGSINSTSQNWPLPSDPGVAAPYATAKLQKSDWWEIWSGRPDDQKVDTQLNGGTAYASYSLIGKMAQLLGGSIQPGPDQGMPLFANPEQNSAMPGISNPYAANDPQPFSRYESSNQWHEANEIPVTDIDDQGRVNPLPLMRVEAFDKATGLRLAATDAVLSNSRDFHCRECHAKDQVGGKDSGRSAAACQYSPRGKGAGNYGHDKTVYCTEDYRTQAVRTNPEIFASVDGNGQSSVLLSDQEFAALKNMTSLHQFYDGRMSYGSSPYGSLIADLLDGDTYNSPDGKTLSDAPRTCAWDCHIDKFIPQNAAFIQSIADSPGVSPNSWPEFSKSNDQTGFENEYSWTIHYFHAQLQYNGDKTDILRHQGEDNQVDYPDGSIKRWDFATQGPNNSTKTGSLFPIFDDNGNQLPMEQNCLRCHAGHREQLYRDRMLTAERTCYDCHGDVAAVGQAFKIPAALGNGATSRASWESQPDCGACHTGAGNSGADKQNGFFSAGVKERAFDDVVTNPATGQNEPNAAAIPRKPNLLSPDESRFAVVLTERNQNPENQHSRLYRFGKDQHGYSGCPACHGAAHGIGPNRDPKSNDNVASIELQGYPGHIYECAVCHTRDAFNTEESIGSVTHYPDAAGKPTILAGPHNLHPVNDPNWFYERTGGDATNQDGTRYGGWHNPWSGKPGLQGEDQCAACHGADHKGTRLSKTPVDRVFDFRGLDFGKLADVGFKSRIVRVKAGTPIGCDTCHNLETSRRNTPTGSTTGINSPRILPPDQPEFTLENGDAPFSFRLQVDNPDKVPLSYAIENSVNILGYPWYRPGTTLSSDQDLTIDGDGKISWANPNLVGEKAFRVKVTDSRGRSSERWFWINLKACATGLSPGTVMCSDIQFSSPPPESLQTFGLFRAGFNADQPIQLTVAAATPDHRSLNYRIAAQAGSPAPGNVAVDERTGTLTITPNFNASEDLIFNVEAVDANGMREDFPFYLTVCAPPQQWDGTMMDGWGMCM